MKAEAGEEKEEGKGYVLRLKSSSVWRSRCSKPVLVLSAAQVFYVGAWCGSWHAGVRPGGCLLEQFSLGRQPSWSRRRMLSESSKAQLRRLFLCKVFSRYPNSNGRQKQSLPLLFPQSFDGTAFLATCLYGIYLGRPSAEARHCLIHLRKTSTGAWHNRSPSLHV